MVGMERIDLAHGTDGRRDIVNAVMNLWVAQSAGDGGEFLTKWATVSFLKMSALCVSFVLNTYSW